MKSLKQVQIVHIGRKNLLFLDPLSDLNLGLGLSYHSFKLRQVSVSFKQVEKPSFLQTILDGLRLFQSNIFIGKLNFQCINNIIKAHAQTIRESC